MIWEGVVEHESDSNISLERANLDPNDVTVAMSSCFHPARRQTVRAVVDRIVLAHCSTRVSKDKFQFVNASAEVSLCQVARRNASSKGLRPKIE
jgi:hypothetical protein